MPILRPRRGDGSIDGRSWNANKRQWEARKRSERRLRQAHRLGFFTGAAVACVAWAFDSYGVSGWLLAAGGLAVGFTVESVRWLRAKHPPGGAPE